MSPTPPSGEDSLGKYLVKEDFVGKPSVPLKNMKIKDLWLWLQEENIFQSKVAFDLGRFLKTGEKILLPSDLELCRVAPQDFGIETKMVHTLDVRALALRLQQVQDWHNDRSVRAKYVAPILPIVQSAAWESQG